MGAASKIQHSANIGGTYRFGAANKLDLGVPTPLETWSASRPAIGATDRRWCRTRSEACFDSHHLGGPGYSPTLLDRLTVSFGC